MIEFLACLLPGGLTVYRNLACSLLVSSRTCSEAGECVLQLLSLLRGYIMLPSSENRRAVVLLALKFLGIISEINEELDSVLWKELRS